MRINWGIAGLSGLYTGTIFIFFFLEKHFFSKWWKTMEYFKNRHSTEMGTGTRGEINFNFGSEFITYL